MSDRPLPRIVLVLAGLLLGLAAAGAGYSAWVLTRAPQQASGGDPLTHLGVDFELTNQSGTTTRLSDLKGKVVLLFFGYTHCPDVCPSTLFTMAQTRKLLGDEAGALKGVFITVDPQRDTPQRLGQYVEFFDPDFLALTGSESQLRDGVLGGLPGGDNPLAPRPPHFPPKARAVIFLFMYGGPSQVDTFDYKPRLYALDGKTIDIATKGRGGTKKQGRIVGPKWGFRQYGQCGRYVSDLFPHVARCVDDIAFVHSMYADSPLHGSAMLMMNSGRILSGAPCMGSWVTYGLGSENENLPGFVVMLDKTGGPISGAKNWSSGYMPAIYQGAVLRPTGEPFLDLGLPPGVTRAEQRRMLDTLREQNEAHLRERHDDTDLAARIASYELAYRMQAHAPEAIDIGSEPDHVQRLYGIDNARTEDFGRKCLLARRLVERGVRFIQIYSGGNHNDHNWDAHGDLEINHNKHAGATDQPIAGLLADLKQRGLLDSTIVVWGGEFGRQPTAEYAAGTGRDHDSKGFTMWLAGGGIRGGTAVGATDELGNVAVEKPFHVKQLHATILHQLGLDPNALAYFYAGLDQRLVGTAGAQPIPELIA